MDKRRDGKDFSQSKAVLDYTIGLLFINYTR